MAGGLIDALWLERRLGEAPPGLAERARAVVDAIDPSADLPRRLVLASERALASAIAKDRDREAAHDLLVADALVTLALEAQVEQAPEHLHEFAMALERRGGAGP